MEWGSAGLKFSLGRITELWSSLKPQIKVGLVLLLGLLLILLSSLGGEDTETVVGEEERLMQICSMIDGVGDCRVMMTYRGEGDDRAVYAVLIVCEGADSQVVREKITESLCSLYGIGAHRVEIQRLYDGE